MRCSKVDLPQPEGPVMATNSRGATLIVAPSSACIRPPSNSLTRSVTSMSGGSFMAQRLDRAEKNRPDGRIQTTDEGHAYRDPERSSENAPGVGRLKDADELRSLL